MAELHGDRKLQTAARLEDQLARLMRRKDPLRKLDEDRPQLACLDQRLKGFPKLPIHRVEQLAWHIFAVDPFLLLQLSGQLFPDRFRQPGLLGRLACHQGMRLDVEDKTLGRSLDPALGRALVGQRVIRRVDFDHGELARVEVQSLFRAVGAARVEHTGGGHGWIRPARGPETNLALADLDRHPRRVVGVFRALPRDLYAGIVRDGLPQTLSDALRARRAHTAPCT